MNLGRQLLIEYYDCDSSILNSLPKLREILLEAANITNATVITDVFHQYSPHGISGVIVIAESHIAIHSWPEFRCASIDIFSCNSKMTPEKAINHLKEKLFSSRYEIQEIARGLKLGLLS